MIAVWLCSAERCAVDERLAPDDPEDADVGLFLPTLCWWVEFGSHLSSLFVVARLAFVARVAFKNLYALKPRVDTQHSE
jgi:hypothetical protein